MKVWKSLLDGLHPHLLIWIWVGLLVLQMVLAFFVFAQRGIPALTVAGWLIWAIGTAFAIVPIFTLRTKGRAPKGRSYMETTTLVDTGIYAVVRHPQGGTAGILFNLALPLIGQHWLIAIPGVVGIGLIYADSMKADQRCLEKFGDDYVRYMQRVPRVNFIAGIVRLLRRRGSQSTAS